MSDEEVSEARKDVRGFVARLRSLADAVEKIERELPSGASDESVSALMELVMKAKL